MSIPYSSVARLLSELTANDLLVFAYVELKAVEKAGEPCV